MRAKNFDLHRPSSRAMRPPGLAAGRLVCRALGLANTAAHRACSAPLASHLARSSIALLAAVSVLISRSQLVLLLCSQYSKREMKMRCKNLAKSDTASQDDAVSQKKPRRAGLVCDRVRAAQLADGAVRANLARPLEPGGG